MTSLDSLTDDQRATVYDWLLHMPTKQVVGKVALPAPEGFGLKTHITTLRRFKDRRWAELAADRIQAATQLACITANQHNTLDTGIQIAIKHHMFERASASNITDDQLAIVSRWSHRQEKLKLEIQRVQIARDRCAQNQLRLQLLARSKSLSIGRDAERVSAQVNISSGAFHPRPTSVPGNYFSPPPQPPTAAAPAEQQTQDTPASTSQLHSPSETSSFILPNSSLGDDRPCDHLGPLARNWEDVRERARKAFGITKEESARRAELRRTWKDPYNYNDTASTTPTSSPDRGNAVTLQQVLSSPSFASADDSQEAN